MTSDNDSRSVRTWIEYVDRYLPEDAKFARLTSDPANLGEEMGRLAIQRALAKLTESGMSGGSTARRSASSE